MARKLVAITPTRKTIRRTPIGGVLRVSPREARLFVTIGLAEYYVPRPEPKKMPQPDPIPLLDDNLEVEELELEDKPKKKRQYRRRDLEAEG